MLKRSATRLYGLIAGALASLAVAAAPAAAQFTPQPFTDRPPAEQYIIEGSAGFWSPVTDMVISSESLGIPGSLINFKTDLAQTDKRFREMHLVLHAAKKHKFRFQYIPITYSQDNVIVRRDIIFNGQLYRLGLPVNWEINWKASRFAYEYDFVSRTASSPG